MHSHGKTATSPYVYDPLCQLIAEPGHTYAFDGLYNRVAKDTQEYGVNNAYLLTQQGETEYRYTPNGGVIYQKKEGIETTYVYDARDRLKSTTCGDRHYTYLYDPLDRRLSKTEWHAREGIWHRAHTQEYVYQGEHEIAVYEGPTRTVLRMLQPESTGEAGATLAIEADGNEQSHLYPP